MFSAPAAAQRLTESIAALERTLAQEGHANREQERREDTGSKWIEGLTLFFVILTTAGIFYQAGILHNTDKAIQVSAVATKDAALAARDAAEATKEAVEVTRDAMRLDQRAWIAIRAITPVPPIPEIGKTLGASVVIQNVGKTPARRVSSDIVLRPVASRDVLTFEYDDSKRRAVGTLSPNVTIASKADAIVAQPAGTKGEFLPILLNQQFIDEISRNDLKIYFYGRIDYEDIFGVSHWLTFCTHLTAPFNGTFSFCDSNNDTDDYKPAKK